MNTTFAPLPVQPISFDQSNSVDAQRQRIVDFLCEHNRATSIEIRNKLDVLHPAGRVMELRDRGWNISTIYEFHPTPCGVLHRVGVYVLLNKPKG